MKNGDVTLKGLAIALRLLPKTWQDMHKKYVTITEVDGNILLSAPGYPSLMFEDGKWVTICVNRHYLE